MTTGDHGDLGDDPLERLERNEAQSNQAFRYVLLSVIAMAAVAVGVIVVADVTGSPCDQPGGMCVTAPRVELVLLPTLLGFVLSVTSMWKTYNRWRDHIRWRPWLFATYAMWMATTACLLLTSTIAFVEIGPA
ncbi:MAG TPA: hypothetical protein H9759_00530 [Candidatus Dietzia intestinipullorum]|nr:hypothetical protein [Candidatus Dietzia intestinipullorum]